MTTSIIINTTRNGDKKQRAVSNIDPNATANNLIEFSRKLIILSNDVYISTVRINKEELTWTEANNNG